MTLRKPSQRIFAGPVLRAQPDQRLVALAREGHESAVEEIVRRYRPGLVRFASSIVRADRADDVVQDSLARALPRIGAGGADLRLRPWLYTIVRNTAFNHLRDAGPPHAQLDESYDGVEQPPQAMERREQVRSLVAGLQGLPEPQRKALVKRELEGRSHAEIGAEMGVSTGAARQLIFRARHALRTGLGSLVPMPLLRHLAESSDGSAVAVVGGGTVVAKAAIALVAAGAVVTAGVGIQHGDRPSDLRSAIVDRAPRGREEVTALATPAARGEAESLEIADPKPRSTHDALGMEAATGSEDRSGPDNPQHEALTGHDVEGGSHAGDDRGGRGGGGPGNDARGGSGHGDDRSGGGESLSSGSGDNLSGNGGPGSGEEGSSSGESGSSGGEGVELSGGDGDGELSSGSGSSSEGSRDSSGSDGFSGTTDQPTPAGAL
jgi:RNA polymerase sigma factor (sigma-70 family)